MDKYLVSITILLILLMQSPSIAGQQAETAIKAVKALIKQGKIPQNTSLRLVVKHGNIHNYWGKDFSLKKEWEKQTGILLDANARPQLPALDYMRQRKNFDITVVRNHALPDLYSLGLIENLTPYQKKYGPALLSSKSDAYILLHQQAWFDGKMVAIPADNDIAVMYLRKDLLNDPQHQENYKQRYRQQLKTPLTWDEYQNHVEFFTDIPKSFYGACEQREPETAWMMWLPRYSSKSLPNQYLFDENMKPLIDSPEGIAATENYISTIPFSPPNILKEGNNYSYTLPFYLNGNCYSYILTLAAAKIFNLDSSSVKDKIVTVPMPGSFIENTLVRRTTFIYGNNLVINTNSPHKELAYLYLLWLTDADISGRSVAVRKGFADPFRYNHFENQEIITSYTRQALDVLLDSIPLTVPAGTGLPGDTEYLSVLNSNLWRAGKGEISAEEAMQTTASNWEMITERYGRQQQIMHLKNFKNKHPK